MNCEQHKGYAHSLGVLECYDIARVFVQGKVSCLEGANYVETLLYAI